MADATGDDSQDGVNDGTQDPSSQPPNMETRSTTGIESGIRSLYQNNHVSGQAKVQFGDSFKVCVHSSDTLGKRPREGSMDGPQTKRSRLNSESTISQYHDSLLTALEFPEMHRRHAKITGVEKHTFEWIFESHDHSQTRESSSSDTLDVNDPRPSSDLMDLSNSAATRTHRLGLAYEDELSKPGDFYHRIILDDSGPEVSDSNDSDICNPYSEDSESNESDSSDSEGSDDNVSMSNDSSDEEDYDVKCDNFNEWLLYDSGYFLINGKIGSGKSTLMKYIQSHRRTDRALAQWAKRSVVLKPFFFFWNEGGDLHRSLEGFLRALLYQVLHQYPDLTDFMLSRLQRKQRTLLDRNRPQEIVWNDRQLNRTLRILMKILVSSNLHFCFFIDGLDEYDGEFEALLGLMDFMVSLSNVKVCAATRPIDLLNIHFKNSETLSLQDLTQSDIRTYVSRKLGRKTWLRKSIPNRYELHEIASSIVKKAEGVFLWVYLVIEGLSENEFSTCSRFEELLKYLDVLPIKLRGLFQHIISRLRVSSNSLQVSLYLHVMACARSLGQVDALTFYLSVCEQTQDDFISITATETPEAIREEVIWKSYRLMNSLSSRTGGLLHISPRKHDHPGRHHDEDSSNLVFHIVWHSDVEFLHRSVLKFVSDLDDGPFKFDQARKIATMERIAKATIIGFRWHSPNHLLHDCIISLYQCERVSGSSNQELTSGYRNALNLWMQNKDNMSWCEIREALRSAIDKIPRPRIERHHYQCSVKDFDGLLTSFGLFLHAYQTFEACSMDSRQKLATYLLSCADDTVIHWNSPKFFDFDLSELEKELKLQTSFRETMLRHGADPNALQLPCQQLPDVTNLDKSYPESAWTRILSNKLFLTIPGLDIDNTNCFREGGMDVKHKIQQSQLQTIAIFLRANARPDAPIQFRFILNRMHWYKDEPNKYVRTFGHKAYEIRLILSPLAILKLFRAWNPFFEQDQYLFEAEKALKTSGGDISVMQGAVAAGLYEERFAELEMSLQESSMVYEKLLLLSTTSTDPWKAIQHDIVEILSKQFPSEIQISDQWFNRLFREVDDPQSILSRLWSTGFRPQYYISYHRIWWGCIDNIPLRLDPLVYRMLEWWWGLTNRKRLWLCDHRPVEWFEFPDDLGDEAEADDKTDFSYQSITPLIPWNYWQGT